MWIDRSRLRSSAVVVLPNTPNTSRRSGSCKRRANCFLVHASWGNEVRNPKSRYQDFSWVWTCDSGSTSVAASHNGFDDGVVWNEAGIELEAGEITFAFGFPPIIIAGLDRIQLAILT